MGTELVTEVHPLVSRVVTEVTVGAYGLQWETAQHELVALADPHPVTGRRQEGLFVARRCPGAGGSATGPCPEVAALLQRGLSAHQVRFPVMLLQHIPVFITPSFP